jgi:hypothetical protein
MNIINFSRRKLYQDFGMKELIERFYNSIQSNNPPPIPYREILLTALIMDEIFKGINPAKDPEARGQRSEARLRVRRGYGAPRRVEDGDQRSDVRDRKTVLTHESSESALTFATTNLRSAL